MNHGRCLSGSEEARETMFSPSSRESSLPRFNETTTKSKERGCLGCCRCQCRWVVVCLLLLGIIVVVSFEIVVTLERFTCDHFPSLQQMAGVPIAGVPRTGSSQCSMESCFDRAKCPQDPRDFKVYLYPEGPSVIGIEENHFLRIRDALEKSPYRTDDPNKACLYFPNFDMTCGSGTTSTTTNWWVTKRLRDLPYWGNGLNHFVIEHNDRDSLEYVADNAIVWKTSFRDRFYRVGFDVAFPMDFYPTCRFNTTGRTKTADERKLLAFFQGRRTAPVRAKVHQLHNGKDIISIWGSSKPYCKYLEDAVFGLNPRGNGLHTHRTLEIFAAGAIPVNIVDHYVLPFSEVLDWNTFSVNIPEHRVWDVPKILRSITPEQRRKLQKKALYVYHKFFDTKAKQVDVALEIIKSRIYNSSTLPFQTDFSRMTNPQ
eukprot:gb/GECG01004598.1/.p1 GENE.gb/GECG01004598.1/~~gb/GECG01004598.1/.p1  ORF type:complete len:428 (+),score=30.25 gb/GECG01004598.1/:1-1284(+)